MDSTVDLDLVEKSDRLRGSRDRFLLDSILIFVLRKGYKSISKEVIQFYNHFSFKPPPFCVWCCAALLFPRLEEENLSDNVNLSNNCQNQLENLITTGDALFSGLNDLSRCKPSLYNYLKEAKRVIMHLYLESFSSTSDYTLCFSKLNQYFPVFDPSEKVQKFRFRFLKLLASEQKVTRYLNEKWIPARSYVLQRLHRLALDIVEQLPEVLLDKVGSSEWIYNDAILLQLNTLLALMIHQQLLYNKSACTEKDIAEILHTYYSHSCPSQLLS
ncbi:unnamed protein product [Schistosoma turkestanicum]|nr:unnamed protein product [Schistosoma turkestanicum]